MAATKKKVRDEKRTKTTTLSSAKKIVKAKGPTVLCPVANCKANKKGLQKSSLPAHMYRVHQKRGSAKCRHCGVLKTKTYLSDHEANCLRYIERALVKEEKLVRKRERMTMKMGSVTTDHYLTLTTTNCNHEKVEEATCTETTAVEFESLAVETGIRPSSKAAAKECTVGTDNNASNAELKEALKTLMIELKDIKALLGKKLNSLAAADHVMNDKQHDFADVETKTVLEMITPRIDDSTEQLAPTVILQGLNNFGASARIRSTQEPEKYPLTDIAEEEGCKTTAYHQEDQPTSQSYPEIIKIGSLNSLDVLIVEGNPKVDQIGEGACIPTAETGSVSDEGIWKSVPIDFERNTSLHETRCLHTSTSMSGKSTDQTPEERAAQIIQEVEECKNKTNTKGRKLTLISKSNCGIKEHAFQSQPHHGSFFKQTLSPIHNNLQDQNEKNHDLEGKMDRPEKRRKTANLMKPAPHKVGIVYNDLMLNHRNLADPKYLERPERISNIYTRLVDSGLHQRCLKLNPREATEEELSLVHTKKHIKKMKETQKMSNKELIEYGETFDSIFFNNCSYKAALVASGSVLEVVDNVLKSICQSGVAIVRPPGHHAEKDHPRGFCIFNNVAVAAKYAITNYELERILIVDWDVHHGNGIQRMFANDPRVLYVSIHRYDNGSFYPYSRIANYNVVGRGEGTGFTVNIPWNTEGMGDTEYLAAFTKIILPIAKEYKPELVLVSAGFDAADGDPLGGCKVSPEGYAQMTRHLSSLANGKIILALEGGYNLTPIADSMSLCTKALLGDPMPPLSLNDEINPDALNSIENVIDVHSRHWTALKAIRT